MKAKYTLLVLTMLFLASCSWWGDVDITGNTISIERSWKLESLDKHTSCSLSLWTTASENPKENTIEVENGTQKNPINLEFYDLDSESPYLKSNNGNSSLIKIDNKDFIYLIETTNAGNTVIYMLMKDRSVLLMSKQYSSFWAFGMQMIWYCK